MEAVNHGMLSRKELREFLEEKGMMPRVLVFEDGETLRRGLTTWPAFRRSFTAWMSPGRAESVQASHAPLRAGSR
jgi:hypothetical protein